MTEKLIQEFKSLYKEIKKVVDKFPQDKREEILFDKWSLKDVIAHLNHWAVHNLMCFKALKEGGKPYWAPDIDEYNEQGVQIRKNRTWNDVYNEFNTLLPQIILDYETLPQDLWNKRFWENRKFTPLKFLEIDINHYKNEHLPQLKKYTERFKGS